MNSIMNIAAFLLTFVIISGAMAIWGGRGIVIVGCLALIYHIVHRLRTGHWLFGEKHKLNEKHKLKKIFLNYYDTYISDLPEGRYLPRSPGAFAEEDVN